ncbi:hypothetical protein CAPTEDRAFT_205850 [Capitella teleta]|uniref:Uncharacterized protein n=1 Tax=Capitella teleta TaxID=283909 RepID=R7TQK7_CAPTE|nr:hypothetical protein CAPTEDRAFT_205850 [Capitella teleta]|eukprot:ELT95827.1 hypothetical protein CAPTEDRAFT_205850 [Capitella teleta]
MQRSPRTPSRCEPMTFPRKKSQPRKRKTPVPVNHPKPQRIDNFGRRNQSKQPAVSEYIFHSGDTRKTLAHAFWFPPEEPASQAIRECPDLTTEKGLAAHVPLGTPDDFGIPSSRALSSVTIELQKQQQDEKQGRRTKDPIIKRPVTTTSPMVQAMRPPRYAHELDTGQFKYTGHPFCFARSLEDQEYIVETLPVLSLAQTEPKNDDVDSDNESWMNVPWAGGKPCVRFASACRRRKSMSRKSVRRQSYVDLDILNGFSR